MARDKSKLKTPYPKFGEIFRFLTVAFGTKRADSKVAKKLDDLAREGDVDWILHRTIINELLVDPIKEVDFELGDLLEAQISHFRSEYAGLVRNVSLDALTREQAMPVLIEQFFSSCAANFVACMKDKFDGPDLSEFMGESIHPVDVVFRWSANAMGLDAQKAVGTIGKEFQDKVARWRNRKQIPDLFGSILPLKHALEGLEPGKRNKIAQLARWLVIARALAWLENVALDSGLPRIRASFRKDLLLCEHSRDVGEILSYCNCDEGKRFPELLSSHLNAWEYLGCRTEKSLGDQLAARQALDSFSALVKQYHPEGRSDHMFALMEARWHLLSGHLNESLNWYFKAAQTSFYRSGKNQAEILEEALILAAHLKKKTILNNLKNQAVALELFPSSMTLESVSRNEFEDWEIDDFARAFNSTFPADCRFREVSCSSSSTAKPNSRSAEFSLDIHTPDFRKPNRVISTYRLDGSKRPTPQLQYFVETEQIDVVQRLLESGADTNALDWQGNSALSIALNTFEMSGDRSFLDLIMQYPHSLSVMNQLNLRDRSSPLSIAILTGEPTIVGKLIEMGADADKSAGYPELTPLYACLSHRLSLFSEDGQKRFRQRVMNPGPEDRDFYRRHAGPSAGLTGEVPEALAHAHPMMLEILESMVRHSINKTISMPKQNFMEILETLLVHGADSNRPLESPRAGYTPLMLAAELDEIDAFKLMMEYGGDPNLADKAGNNCMKIAIGFGSSKVINWLRDHSRPN
ncbi:MAG: ankyrin repeat domain-containing protein [Rhodospirillales bacterium]